MPMTECACRCGTTRIHLRAAPKFRMLCHCTICQRFNQAPFADVLIYAARDVELMDSDTVEFSTYKPPPNVQRGKCTKCGQAAVETFHVPLLPKLAMVPRAMHAADASLPEPVAHFFYETRVADAEDALPKHKGFMPSQWAFLQYYLREKRSDKRLSSGGSPSGPSCLQRIVSAQCA